MPKKTDELTAAAAADVPNEDFVPEAAADEAVAVVDADPSTETPAAPLDVQFDPTVEFEIADIMEDNEKMAAALDAAKDAIRWLLPMAFQGSSVHYAAERVELAVAGGLSGASAAWLLAAIAERSNAIVPQ
jgi:hypothetical protein